MIHIFYAIYGNFQCTYIDILAGPLLPTWVRSQVPSPETVRHPGRIAPDRRSRLYQLHFTFLFRILGIWRSSDNFVRLGLSSNACDLDSNARVLYASCFALVS